MFSYSLHNITHLSRLRTRGRDIKRQLHLWTVVTESGNGHANESCVYHLQGDVFAQDALFAKSTKNAEASGPEATTDIAAFHQYLTVFV